MIEVLDDYQIISQLYLILCRVKEGKYMPTFMSFRAYRQSLASK